MRTKLGLAIKLWTEMWSIRASGDSSSATCNSLVDSLSNLDSQLFELGKRLDAIERRLTILEGSEPGRSSDESSI